MPPQYIPTITETPYIKVRSARIRVRGKGKASSMSLTTIISSSATPLRTMPSIVIVFSITVTASITMESGLTTFLKASLSSE